MICLIVRGKSRNGAKKTWNKIADFRSSIIFPKKQTDYRPVAKNNVDTVMGSNERAKVEKNTVKYFSRVIRSGRRHRGGQAGFEIAVGRSYELSVL